MYVCLCVWFNISMACNSILSSEIRQCLAYFLSELKPVNSSQDHTSYSVSADAVHRFRTLVDSGDITEYGWPSRHFFVSVSYFSHSVLEGLLHSTGLSWRANSSVTFQRKAPVPWALRVAAPHWCRLLLPIVMCYQCKGGLASKMGTLVPKHALLVYLWWRRTACWLL